MVQEKPGPAPTPLSPQQCAVWPWAWLWERRQGNACRPQTRKARGRGCSRDTCLVLPEHRHLLLQADVLLLQLRVVLQQAGLSELILLDVIPQAATLRLHVLVDLPRGRWVWAAGHSWSHWRWQPCSCARTWLGPLTSVPVTFWAVLYVTGHFVAPSHTDN